MKRSGREKSTKSLKSKEESDRIRVYVRIKPSNAQELDRGEANGIDVALDRTELKLTDGKVRTYTFDKIFTPQTHNREVFQVVGKPLVDAAFTGFNGTLMAYGQTGTGKTYTLMASDGIAALSVEKLFRRIQLDNYHGYKVTMSYIQIYQEKLFDLLNANPRVKLTLRENPCEGIYVENLTKFKVHGPSEVAALLKIGKKRLVVAETRMNRISSSSLGHACNSHESTAFNSSRLPLHLRSHSVCQITVERSLNKGTPKETSPSSPSSSCSSPPAGALSPPPEVFPMAMSSGSLDRLAKGSRLPRRKRSLSTNKFNPKLITSTPNLAKSTGSLAHRHSVDLTSLPQLPHISRSDSNRWSLSEINCFPGHLDNNSTFGSEDSMLYCDLASSQSSSDSFWPSSPDIPQYDFDDDDEDSTFLENIRITEDVVIKGKLNICDLAGSERLKRSRVQGDRLSELQHINLSLLELGNTIHALSDGNKRTHIPFRNSTLTRLLQDSLGGNCKTGFVLCISPSFRDLNETRCTLDFGQRALKITNTARVNVEVDFAKLSEDLRRKLEAQELEIKSQKDTFEQQTFAFKSETEIKLAEAEALLETERQQNKAEIKLLKIEQENLRRALAQQESRIERECEVGADRRQDELEKPQNKDERWNEESQNVMEEEKRRALIIEERTREELEKATEEERQRSESLILNAEMEKLERSLEYERKRILDLENRLETSLLLEEEQEREINTPTNINNAQVLPVASGPSETLFNVLLAEIMSLQLMYQMQDLSRAYHVDAPESRDSGCADYDDVLLESVSSTLLEKGELILNSLRDKQRRESRVSLTSADSFRELYLLQFPSPSPTPKVSLEEVQKIRRFHSASLSSIKEIHELLLDSKKTVSSDDILMPTSQDSENSSSGDDLLLTSLDSKQSYYSDDLLLSSRDTESKASLDSKKIYSQSDDLLLLSSRDEESKASLDSKKIYSQSDDLLLSSSLDTENKVSLDSKKLYSQSDDLLLSSSRDAENKASLDSKKTYSQSDDLLSSHNTEKASSTDGLLIVPQGNKKNPPTDDLTPASQVCYSSSSSSLESFCEDEPLSPRVRSRPSDSGCSSQYSDWDQFSWRAKRSDPVDVNVLQRVPLAEEEDENIDSDDILDDDEQMQSLKKRVLYLGKDLLQLKSELDGETISFFSNAFGVDVPLDDARADLSHVMRCLFEGVTERLLTGSITSPSNIEGEEESKDLSPVLLEEALNLLLVNKTVMSCILILQSRKPDDENGREEESTEPHHSTAIDEEPTADKQIQTDLDPSPRHSRRRIRRETGVGTDPVVTPSVRHQDSQTSREDLSIRLPNVSCSTEDTLETVIPAAMDPWICRFEQNIEELDSDHEQEASGSPGGAYNVDSPAVANQFTVVRLDSSNSHQTSSDDEDDEDKKRGGKKKKVTTSCLGFARRSFRRRSQRKRSNANHSKS